jgi:chaperone required for assembly of F1-ATPase
VSLFLRLRAFRLLISHHKGYERAVYTTKSALIALALVRQRLTVEQAAQAAHVEVNSQIERWGEVEDCE